MGDPFNRIVRAHIRPSPNNPRLVTHSTSNYGSVHPVPLMRSIPPPSFVQYYFPVAYHSQTTPYASSYNDPLQIQDV